MNYFGIDISKKHIDVCPAGSTKVNKYPNTPQGWSTLLEDFTGDNNWFVMEATGPYFVGLAHWLCDKDQRVSVINPLIIRRYGQLKLKRIKTDKADARLIADYSSKQHEDLVCWQPKSVAARSIRQLLALLEKTIKLQTIVKNQREAFSQDPEAATYTLQLVEHQLDFLNQQEKQITKELHKLAKAEYDPILKSLQSIPGIGLKTAIIICAITDGLTQFDSSQKLAAYTGICPSPYESGSSIKGKGHISKLGSSLLRKTLYMCTLSGSRYNVGCKQMYERLKAAGKPNKLVRIAVANKLLRQAFMVGKSNSFFDPQKALGA